MLVDLRGGYRNKEDRVLLVSENMLLCKARSITILDIEILYWLMAIIV